MHHEVETQLVQLLTKMGYSSDQLVPTTRFMDDLHLDWLGQVRVVEHLEQHFGIDIPDRDLHAMRTLQDAATSVEQQLHASCSPYQRLKGFLGRR